MHKREPLDETLLLDVLVRLAQFMLETDDPSGRKERVVRPIIHLCINAGKQTDHPSRRNICVVLAWRIICL